MAFDPAEPRDSKGKWFHGTSYAHQPGDIISPPGGETGFDRMFMIHSQKAASHYARTQATYRYSDEGVKTARPHVYEVEPVGPVTDETEHQGSSARQLRVVREVPFQAPYKYAYPAPWEAEDHSMADTSSAL